MYTIGLITESSVHSARVFLNTWLSSTHQQSRFLAFCLEVCYTLWPVPPLSACHTFSIKKLLLQLALVLGVSNPMLWLQVSRQISRGEHQLACPDLHLLQQHNCLHSARLTVRQPKAAFIQQGCLYVSQRLPPSTTGAARLPICRAQALGPTVLAGGRGRPPPFHES